MILIAFYGIIIIECKKKEGFWLRNPERLDIFYDKLKEIHKERFPDIRFGQLMVHIQNLLVSTGKDWFYLEENELIERIKKLL